MKLFYHTFENEKIEKFIFQHLFSFVHLNRKIYIK